MRTPNPEAALLESLPHSILRTRPRSVITQMLTRKFAHGRQFDAETVYQELQADRLPGSLATIRATLRMLEAHGKVKRRMDRRRALFQLLTSGRRRAERS